MSAAEYLAGLGWLLVITVSHARIALLVRSWSLPGSSRAASHLGDAILFLASLLTLGQVLGSLGLLSWSPVFFSSTALGIAAEAALRRHPPIVAGRGPQAVGRAPTARLEIACVTACIAAVGWQWSTHLADAFNRGMVQADSTWYHGPFMARFLQTGGFGDLGTLGYAEARYYPFNAELLHALMTLPFHRDLLVPVTNHLMAALALGAAYVLGRRWNVGALAVLGATVVLSLPIVASTQPGQMYNDVMAAALVLAAVALLVDAAGLDPQTFAVAGITLGLAVGTKLSVAGVVAPLAVGVLAIALVARRYRSAITWAASATLTGGFWFARNWVVHGSPAPFVDIQLGPIDWPAQVPNESGEALLETLDDFDVVRTYYAESLRISLGPLWMVLVAVVLTACTAMMIRPRDWRFVAALSAAVGVLAYPMLPLTGGLPFVNNLRYTVTVLLLAMALAALAVATRPLARAGLVLVCSVMVVANLLSDHRGRVVAWPGYHVWGLVTAIAVVGGVWSWLRRASWRLPWRPGAAPVGLTLALMAVVGGWFLQRHYVANRYVDTGLDEEALHRPFTALRGTAVDVLGTVETYVMFGPDLSNRVTVWNEYLEPTNPAPRDPCRFWRRVVGTEQGYVAISNGWLLRDISPAERAEWFEHDSAVTTVVDTGDMTVYFHDRRLDPRDC